MSTPTAQSASQVIADALVAINVIRDGQTPSAEMQAQAIRRLNQLMAVWEAEGRNLGYIPVGTATAILTVPDAAIMGIYSSLAILLAPSFGASVSQELVVINDRGMAIIDKITAKDVRAQLDLHQSADRCAAYNINTD
jgi:hypothetical protein